MKNICMNNIFINLGYGLFDFYTIDENRKQTSPVDMIFYSMYLV